MAGNIYLYLDGIPGESTSSIFTNWIDIDSFSYGVAMEIDMEARIGSGGGTSGSADPEDFSFDTKMSLATTVLLQCCALGAVIPRGRLLQCNVVDNMINVVSDYAIGDSLISSVTVNASGGEIPSMSFSVNYGSIIWRYHCYNHYFPSVHLADVPREWSLLSANPQRADPNTYDAFQNIAPDKRLVPPENKSKNKGISHTFTHSGFGGSSRVIFKPGPEVYMESDFKKLNK